MAKNYLVTGVAGTGKTTLGKLLAQRGYDTSDLDHGFAGWYDRQTMKPCEYNPAGGREWLDAHTFRLHLPILKAHLAEKHKEPVIMLGHTGDIYDQRNLFDHVFLLEYPNDKLLIHRLTTREGNPYGKHPEELTHELARYKTFQEQFRVAGATAIDCSQSLETIAEIIENDIGYY